MRQNLLVFGDSISYGAWCEMGGWVDRLKIYREKQRIQDSTYYLTYNLGIPGETVEGLQARFLEEAKRRISANPESNQIIFAYGMNDLAANADGSFLVDPDKFQEIYLKVIQQSKQLATKVQLLTITPIHELADPNSILGRKNSAINQYNQIIKQLGIQEEIEVIDIHEVFSSNNVALLLDTDGLHPNSAGHELIFRTVVSKLM
jgi:lysophospholipase L1-like esterase